MKLSVYTLNGIVSGLSTIRLKHDPYFTSFVPLDDQPAFFSIPKNRMDQIEPDKNSEPESERDFPF
jgi:hypothetical protein